MSSVQAPVSLTTFVGRGQEVATVRGLLESTRLLTLTGAGGSGKTRLASEVAAQAAAHFSDGLVWVELAPLGAELIPYTILAALGAEQGARAPMVALIETLRDREMLLVLDNCEHVVDACASLAETLLRACPRLSILATSREALGVGGERAWLVPGLSLPRADGSPETVAQSEAVRLFVDRAQAALATFRLTPANAAAVAQICRRLDGLPLAIELAAARVRALPPEQLATRLDDAFRVLSSGARTAVPRHRTLREAIDWSYQLLDEREKTLLQRLSQFAGDFTLDAAESVAAGDDLEAADVLDTLGALVDKSLVNMREAEGTARYYLLETIKQYAVERLRESGEFQLVCNRHAMTYVGLVAQAAPHFVTRDRPEWVRRIHRELDNIRVAMGCTWRHAPEEHVRLAGMLGWFWYSTGLWSEGRRWLEGAIAMPASDATRPARAAALLGAGVLASLQADTKAALPWLEEAADIARSIGDRRIEAYALAYLGVSYGQSGDPRAREPVERAVAWFREARDLYGLRLGLIVLSTYYFVTGDARQSRALAEEGVAIAREFGLDRELAIALQVLGGATYASGDIVAARGHFRSSLESLRRDPSLYWIARGLQLLGVIIAQLGRPVEALTLIAAAEAARDSIGAKLLKHDADRLAPVLARARAEVGEETYLRAWDAGRTMTTEEALEFAVVQGASSEAQPGVRTPSGSHAAMAATPSDLGRSPSRLAGASPAESLRVETLGPLRIARDGQALPGNVWRYARPRELLLYLLAHPEGRTREQIGLAFWPDASPTQVKNNFHVMLHHVRKALSRADLIAFERDRYRIAWELGVRFDARDFEELMRPAIRALKSPRPIAATDALARVEEAMALYRGDFLADEGAGDWHIEIRDRLRQLYSEGVLLLGARQFESGAYREAADAFRRAIAVDELHEEAHRRLMTSLARAGERSEALRQYDRLARTLRADLEAEPEAETRALYDRLRNAEAV